jgi:uncharacterized protein (TIGR00255 family)
MIISMTGFGKSSKTIKKMSINVELRSINSKYLEVSSRMPMIFNDKESEIKEIIGQKISRGKVSAIVSIDKNSSESVNLQIQPSIVKEYYRLLSQIKKATGIKEEIKMEHILKFSEVFKPEESDDLTEKWEDIKKIITLAVNDLYKMKKSEGKVLEKDILGRVKMLSKKLDEIVRLSAKNIKENKEKLLEKVHNLINGTVQIDQNRLEYEISMISDRMDITEEVVRAKSHIDYFIKNVNEKELSGRRLNFLVQEINREINTIASKSSNSSISQNVVEMKEELEKIKEQLQNVE